jgi:hypothetical protein
MSGTEAIFLAALGWVGGLILEREYAWWAPRLASAIARGTSKLMPGDLRIAKRDEWLAEIDTARREGGSGLIYALLLPLGVGAMWTVHRHSRQSSDGTVAQAGALGRTLESLGYSLVGSMGVLHVTGIGGATGGAHAVLTIDGIDIEGTVYTSAVDEVGVEGEAPPL